MKVLDRITLVLIIIGALNWGSVALFNADFVQGLFGGSFAKFIFILVAIAGLWGITMFFRDKKYVDE